MTAIALPPHQGRRIGLLGGSFNPAHEGHLHISRVALNRLSLDGVWWLVSPQNPLKDAGDMAPLSRRLEAARKVAAAEKRVAVLDLESKLGTQYTVDMLERLDALAPAAHFVWLMGADNLASFHLWRRWRDIAHLVPIAVIARPGHVMAAKLSRAARVLSRFEVKPISAYRLATKRPPAWTFVTDTLDPRSATAIRAAGLWPPR